MAGFFNEAAAFQVKDAEKLRSQINPAERCKIFYENFTASSVRRGNEIRNPTAKLARRERVE